MGQEIPNFSDPLQVKGYCEKILEEAEDEFS